MDNDENLVAPFGLNGHVFAGYRIDECLGRGWTAEVYSATEIASGAKRAIKIFANYEDQQRISQQKRVGTVANNLEQLSRFVMTPRYYHLGHAFISDSLGNYFLVQEHIHGRPLSQGGCSRDMIEDFLRRLKAIHSELAIVLRDWDATNLLVTEQCGIRMVDADLGSDKGATGNRDTDYAHAKQLLERFLQ